MKIRPDEFTIGENPMRKHPQTWINHHLEPKAQILVLEGHVTPEIYPHEHYTYTGADGEPELYTFVLYHCHTQEFDSEKHPIIIAKLLKNAWHWYMAYMAYMAWEDKNIEEDEQGSTN